MRAVLDTNVLASAFKDPPGRVAALWQAARQQHYQMVVSPAIMREVAKVLRHKFGWEEPRITRQLKDLYRISDFVIPAVSVAIITDDPDDNRILECAVAGHADVIVSGDRHLRKLKSYQGIPIVRPVDFRRALGLVG